MKKLTFALAASGLLFACGGDAPKEEAKPAFTIDATLTDLSYTTAYLNEYKDGQMTPYDTAQVIDGKFSFDGSIEMPEVRYINFNDGKEMIPFFVENSPIKISGSLKDLENVKVDGSKTHSAFRGFKDEVSTYETKLKAIVDKYYALPDDAPEEEVAAVEAEYDLQDSIRMDFVETFVHNNAGSVISPYIALRELANSYELADLEALNAKFTDEAKASSYAAKIEERIAILKKTAIGAEAPVFSQADAEGNEISLASFKGKYVLVDFWASWCGPCRAENPNVVAAFNKYNEKGFEVFGVSLDENKDKWLEAIEKDALTWKHVSDLKGWGNEAAKMYGVQGIPFSVLVDTEGKIVGKNLRGEELHNKLEEIFSSES